MTVANGLFVDSPEFEDSSLHQMSDDINSWPEEIIMKFKERVPSAEGAQMTVKFIKMDEETGTATGALMISTNTKQCYAPIIIHDFKMSPLDVFIASKKVLPLNQEYFAQAMGDNEVFKALEDYPNVNGGVGRFDDGNLWNTIYPPSLGRYSFASAGVYPILGDISSTIDGKAFTELLNRSPESVIEFQKKGHFELIKKLANSKVASAVEMNQNAPAVIMVSKKAPGKYNILQSTESVFAPALEEGVSRAIADLHISKHKHMHGDIMHEVDRNGEKLLIVPTEGSSPAPWIEGGPDKNIVNVVEPGYYVVRRKDGLEIEGRIITNTIDFNGISTGQKTFLGKNGMFGISENISALRVEKSSFKINVADVKIGQTGVFVCYREGEKPLVTSPITIKSIRTGCGCDGAMTLKCVDFFGIEMNVSIPYAGHMLKRPAKIGSVYTIPSDYHWSPVETIITLPNSIEDYAVKEASLKKTARPVKVIYNGYDRYAVRGLDKYANAMGADSSSMDSSQLKFLLATLGAGSVLDNIIKTAQTRSIAVIHGLKELPLASEKVACYNDARVKVASYCEKLKSNLIKEAAQMENSQSVDVLLSLNFINPDNIQRFVSKLPSLKATISNLASLLIASRLGIGEIPEQAASTAMNRLVEVVNGLEALKATQEKK